MMITKQHERKNQVLTVFALLAMTIANSVDDGYSFGIRAICHTTFDSLEYIRR